MDVFGPKAVPQIPSDVLDYGHGSCIPGHLGTRGWCLLDPRWDDAGMEVHSVLRDGDRSSMEGPRTGGLERPTSGFWGRGLPPENDTTTIRSSLLVCGHWVCSDNSSHLSRLNHFIG